PITWHGPVWITVTGTASPSSANIWVIPIFLPSRPILRVMGRQLLRYRNEGGIYTRGTCVRQAESAGLAGAPGRGRKAGSLKIRAALRVVTAASSSNGRPAQRATTSAVWVRKAGSLRLPRRGTGAR